MGDLFFMSNGIRHRLLASIESVVLQRALYSYEKKALKDFEQYKSADHEHALKIIRELIRYNNQDNIRICFHSETATRKP